MEVSSVPTVSPEGRGRLTGSTELARNALGLPQILFCIVTGSAPLAAMMFNDPLSGLGIGISVPAAFWVSAISFTLFSVGYVEMARRVTTAGGFYSYTSYGFGRIIGLGTAIGIVVAYALFAVGVNGVTTYFANTSLNNLFGISMDWRIYCAIFIVLLLVITYFHVENVARILGICLLGELVILFIFSFAVLFKGGGPNGIVWGALNPFGILGNGAGVSGAAKVFGASAAGVGFFGAYWSWVGFEMAPNYAEEARNPKKMMAYAIYISCIGLGVVYTFWSWMLVSAYGSSKNQWPWAVSTQYGIKTAPASVGLPKGDYSSVYYPVAQHFVGTWMKDLFELLIITGSFACSLAFWNTTNRYLFSMGREGILPRILGRTHSTHKSPFVATICTFAFVVILSLIFATGLAGGAQRSGARHRGVQPAGGAVADRYLAAVPGQPAPVPDHGVVQHRHPGLLLTRRQGRVPSIQDVDSADPGRAEHRVRGLPDDLQPGRADHRAEHRLGIRLAVHRARGVRLRAAGWSQL